MLIIISLILIDLEQILIFPDKASTYIAGEHDQRNPGINCPRLLLKSLDGTTLLLLSRDRIYHNFLCGLSIGAKSLRLRKW
jgi:hypothetical protein